MLDTATVDELIRQSYSPDWGGWQLDRSTYVLVLFDEQGNCMYEVDLEWCTSSAQVLDWIVQVAKKAWATPEVLAGLVHALNYALQPQGTLCSCGTDMRMSREQIRNRVSKLQRSA